MKFGIYSIKEHDHCGLTKPLLHEGYFNTYEEAKAQLDKLYHGGKKQRYDNDFYGYHYWYWDAIYAEPTYFYDMDDYVRDLVESGEWEKMTDEQRKIITSHSLAHTLLWLKLKNKL